MVPPINTNNLGSGVALALGIETDMGIGQKGNNAGMPGNPSATGGSNAGDLALAMIMLATVEAGADGHLAIIGSPANARSAAAATPGTMA